MFAVLSDTKNRFRWIFPLLFSRPSTDPFSTSPREKSTEKPIKQSPKETWKVGNTITHNHQPFTIH